MNKKTKFFIALAALIALAVVLGTRWSNHKDKKPFFRNAATERGDIQVTVLATGVVQPQNRVEVKPPIAGRAEEVLAKEGQTAKKGQILAWMSSVERAALLDAARAKGPQELAHWEDLYKPTPLVAPLNGVIISRKVEPGQTVTAQDAVLVMSNRLIVKAQVDETDIGQVKPDQKSEITLDAYPQEKIAARVDHIAYEAKTVSNVTIYEVDVMPEHVPRFMRSGMTANITFFVSAKKDVLTLPAEAVQNDDGHTFVMVRGEPKNHEGKPDRKEIKTGVSDGKRVEVLSGLEEGDTVLIRPFRMPASSGMVQNNPFMPFSRRRGQSSR